MRLSGATDWGAAYLANNATWIQVALARHWQKLPELEVPGEAQAFLDTVPLLADAEKTWEAGELGDKLAAISQGSFAAVDAMLGAMDATFGSIPIIGMVAKIGIAAQRIFWNRWLASVQPQPAPVGLAYDRGTDEKIQQDMLDRIEGGDITGVFRPPVDLNESGGELEFRRVQDLTIEEEREWLVLPQGPTMGLGFMPGGLGAPRSWQGLGGVLWSDYAPGSLSASVAAWELARGTFADQVDWSRLAAEWFTFWSWIQKAANDLNAEGTDEAKRKRNVLLRALRPISLEPGSAGQQLYGTGSWLGPDQRGAGRSMADVVRDLVNEDKPAPGRRPTTKTRPAFLRTGAVKPLDNGARKRKIVRNVAIGAGVTVVGGGAIWGIGRALGRW